ncbi:MAG TPA: hypothetical protein VMB34_22805 [Acetobacteraceae bacterium]|nr:hypothetical protein [Acetobacteraceae bacterium]
MDRYKVLAAGACGLALAVRMARFACAPLPPVALQPGEAYAGRARQNGDLCQSVIYAMVKRRTRRYSKRLNPVLIATIRAGSHIGRFEFAGCPDPSHA